MGVVVLDLVLRAWFDEAILVWIFLRSSERGGISAPCGTCPTSRPCSVISKSTARGVLSRMLSLGCVIGVG